MELAIINSDVNSLMPPLRDLNTLWVSVLLADKVNYNGLITNFYWMYEMFQGCKKEEEKVRMCLLTFPDIYKRTNIDVNKHCEDLKLFYETLKSLRKQKNKPKDMIVKLIEGEKMLKDTFNNVSKYLQHHLESTGVIHLMPNINEDDKGFIVFNDDITSLFQTKHSEFLNNLKTIFSDDDKYFFSDDCIEKVREKEIDFVSFELIDVPCFEYLNEPQYMEFRKAFLKGNGLFNGMILGLKTEMNGMDYSDENVMIIQKTAEEKIAGCRQDLQDRFNDCILRFTDIPGNSKKYKLCMGFASRENFLSLYNRAKIFTDEMYPYVKEFLVGEMDLKKMMPFFYVRIAKNSDG